MEPAQRWDIFCRVVDNYGDAGVAWRLARLLAREHGKRVRLWLGGLEILARIRPEIDSARESQVLDGVEVARWPEAPVQRVADVVVEMFACDPPESYVAAMARREPRPCWINLEYLSAEDWVEGSHALPSPHPRLPLVKHFFFPGFTPRTGGLLRENDLLARREAFQSDALAQAAFWRAIAAEEPPQGALRVSVFAYATAPIEALLEAFARHRSPVWCVLPDNGLRRPAVETRGSLHAVRVPFLAQDRYDELLWACNVNFVRGEDSFVRAQWAARPFVWNVYPQEKGAHWVKLRAFLGRHAQGLEPAEAAALGAIWDAWNGAGEVRVAWEAFAARRVPLEAAVKAWAGQLGARRDLATELVQFVDKMIK